MISLVKELFNALLLWVTRLSHAKKIRTTPGLGMVGIQLEADTIFL